MNNVKAIRQAKIIHVIAIDKIYLENIRRNKIIEMNVKIIIRFELGYTH